MKHVGYTYNSCTVHSLLSTLYCIERREDELAQVKADIRDARAALKRAEDSGNEALEEAIWRSLTLLLEEKKRLTAGRNTTYSMCLLRPISIRHYPCS
jgi:hypothetical protein